MKVRHWLISFQAVSLHSVELFANQWLDLYKSSTVLIPASGLSPSTQLGPVKAFARHLVVDIVDSCLNTACSVAE